VVGPVQAKAVGFNDLDPFGDDLAQGLEAYLAQTGAVKVLGRLLVANVERVDGLVGLSALVGAALLGLVVVRVLEGRLRGGSLPRGRGPGDGVDKGHVLGLCLDFGVGLEVGVGRRVAGRRRGLLGQDRGGEEMLEAGQGADHDVAIDIEGVADGFCAVDALEGHSGSPSSRWPARGSRRRVQMLSEMGAASVRVDAEQQGGDGAQDYQDMLRASMRAGYT
jgi:hypothetical protein